MYQFINLDEVCFFPTDNLLLKIKKANNISGQMYRIKGGFFYLGNKIYEGRSVGFLFVPDMDDNKLVKLLGLKCMCKENDLIVVLMPTSRVDDVQTRDTLYNNNVIQEPLLEVMTQETYELCIDGALDFLIHKETNSVQAVSMRQMAGYKAYSYQCSDRLNFLNKPGRGRCEWIAVNHHEIDFPYHEYMFLLYFSLRLKEGSGGWVSLRELEEKNVARDGAHVQRVISCIRRKIRSYLKDKGQKRLVENDRKGNYRISTHPDFIECPGNGWMTGKFDDVLKLVIGERKRRKVWDG